MFGIAMNESATIQTARSLREAMREVQPLPAYSSPHHQSGLPFIFLIEVVWCRDELLSGDATAHRLIHSSGPLTSDTVRGVFVSYHRQIHT
jgi:hypothetical protein